jgi:hypothetical protein
LKKFLLSSLFLSVLLSQSLNSTAISATKSGWQEFNRAGITYFKPFVSVKNPKNKLVLFVTSTGKVYKGRCYKRYRRGNFCREFPQKRFFDTTDEVLYLIFEINPPYAPQLIRKGVVGEE